ncbi:unnamed protein product [Adineta steineri]|uniref:Uncharacterized protein n=1 Tax=Adineta steineri TaxID=433720 RepID=A0A815CH66_9BILA|nr:unnamed protein product [Adineta steineri]CAF1567646.1 unnamed protein product [Adineta steineri]
MINKSLIPLVSIDGIVYSVFDTTTDSDSHAVTAGSDICQYPIDQSPDKACDGDISTKYLNFGEYQSIMQVPTCCLNTGFYLESKRGASTITGFQVCARFELDVGLQWQYWFQTTS